MCLNVFYFCFCCGTRVIDINIWKCYYQNISKENQYYLDYHYFDKKFDPEHLINVKHFETVFGMCQYCELKCEKKCSLVKFVEKDYFIERIHFQPLSIYKEEKKNIFFKLLQLCGIRK